LLKPVVDTHYSTTGRVCLQAEIGTCDDTADQNTVLHIMCGC